MPIPRDYPLESFDPRIKELLIRGAKEDFTIQCKSQAEAHRLQFMLNSFRKRLRRDFPNEPEQWKPLFFAVISRVKDDSGKRTKIRIYSRHHEFDDALASLTVKPPTVHLEKDPLEDLLPPLVEKQP